MGKSEQKFEAWGKLSTTKELGAQMEYALVNIVGSYDVSPLYTLVVMN